MERNASRRMRLIVSCAADCRHGFASGAFSGIPRREGLLNLFFYVLYCAFEGFFFRYCLCICVLYHLAERAGERLRCSVSDKAQILVFRGTVACGASCGDSVVTTFTVFFSTTFCL